MTADDPGYRKFDDLPGDTDDEKLQNAIQGGKVRKPESLAEFLLARIADDRRTALFARMEAEAGEGYLRLLPEGAYNRQQAVDLARASRVLAECESKRRIVEAARDYSPELEHGDNGEWAFDTALRFLALPYASHPDFREEWRA